MKNFVIQDEDTAYYNGQKLSPFMRKDDDIETWI